MGLTRRELLQASLGAAVLPAARAMAMPGAKKTLRVAFFSDTHVAVGRNVNENKAMLTEIAALNPDFCINAGDVTDQGWADQVEIYLRLVKESGLKVHHCPGNHDVRWSPLGPVIFEDSFGKPYRAIEVEGCWFIILDTTTPLSHWGNVASPQVEWLAKTLKLIGQSAPIFIFGHHWVGRETVQVDNEAEIIKLIRPHNVKLIGVGHGHSDLKWEVEGRVALMNRGLYQLSYCMMDIDLEAKTVVVSRRTAEKALHEIARGDLGRPVQPKAWRLDMDRLENLPLGTDLRADGGEWVSAFGSTPFAFRNEGYHEIDVRRPDSPYIERYKTGPEGSKIKPIWSRDLPGGVMSHVIADGAEVFVSTMGGWVLCIDQISGREVWRQHVGGYCHSSPRVGGDHVFVGSSNGHLFALNRKHGRIVWQRKLLGPVYATPAMAQGIVFISNHGLFYGLDAQTGEIKWRSEMPKSNTNFGQSCAATDGHCFIQGCWDSHLYCLDALTGEVKWRNPCQEKTFAFSPAIGSPFIALGHVYVVANGNGLFKFEIATGKKVFEVASAGQKFGHSGPCVVGDRVFAGCLGDGEGEVRCLSAIDGKELWSAKTGSTIYDSCVRASPRGFLTVNSVPGVVNVLTQADGRLLGQFRLGTGHALGTSAVVDDLIFAASFAKRLECMRVQADV